MRKALLKLFKSQKKVFLKFGKINDFILHMIL